MIPGPMRILTEESLNTWNVLYTTTGALSTYSTTFLHQAMFI